MINSAGNELAIQKFTILLFGAENLKKAMCIGAEVHHNLKNITKKKYGKEATNVGDGSMFTTKILENKKAAAEAWDQDNHLYP